MSETDDIHSRVPMSGFRDLVGQLEDLADRIARLRMRTEDLQAEARSVSQAVDRLLGGEVSGLDRQLVAMLGAFVKREADAAAGLTVDPLTAFIASL